MSVSDRLIIAEIRFSTFPGLTPVVLSYSEREHIYRRHPEIRDHEHTIVQAIRYPAIIVKDIVHDDTFNFFTNFNHQHHVLVSVELGEHPDVARVKSARIQRMSRTSRMKSKAIVHYGADAVVFENGGK